MDARIGGPTSLHARRAPPQGTVDRQQPPAEEVTRPFCQVTVLRIGRRLPPRAPLVARHRGTKGHVGGPVLAGARGAGALIRPRCRAGREAARRCLPGPRQRRPRGLGLLVDLVLQGRPARRQRGRVGRRRMRNCRLLRIHPIFFPFDLGAAPAHRLPRGPRENDPPHVLRNRLGQVLLAFGHSESPARFPGGDLFILASGVYLDYAGGRPDHKRAGPPRDKQKFATVFPWTEGPRN